MLCWRRELADERTHITEGYSCGAIDDETSREQLDRNRAEDAELAPKEAELEPPLPEDLESLTPLAKRVLTEPGGLWR